MKSQATSRRANLDQERARYENICRQNPRNFQAWWNLGRINLELGYPQRAIVVFDKALSLKPKHLEVLIGKILACVHLNRLEDALEAVERAQALAPSNSDVLLHKGNVLNRLGRSDEALAVHERILTLPGLSLEKRLYVLSVKIAILTNLSRYEEALDMADQGLALSPQSVTFLLNRSTMLVRLGHYEEALVALGQLIPPPGAMEFTALCNKVRALAGLRRFAEAEAVLGELRGRYPQEVQERRFGIPVEKIPEDAAIRDHTAEGTYLGALFDALKDCDWRCYETLLSELANYTAELQHQGGVPQIDPFWLLSLPVDQELRLAVARDRARQFDADMAPLRSRLQIAYPSRKQGERLRIGYVSGDFRDHATAHLTRKLFKVHDRSRFEIFGYSLRPGDDSVYFKDISSACDRFVDLARLSNLEAAKRIARDGVHILVDLHGYTKFARTEIFALRPAPVQVSYLGYPGTMGADFIQYILADREVLPEEHLRYYTEQPVYLPDCYQVNDDSQPIAETGISRADQNLPGDAFVYCCFNAAHKIEPQTFAVWMRILNQVPDSVLWLLAKNQRIANNLHREARQHGVDPQRLIFAQRLPKPEHLERYRLADLFLDTFVYNAHTTASDALWAGLPVLTLRGEAFPARVCASLLSAIGLAELITDDAQAFEALAIGLAQGRGRLAALREKLASHRTTHPLFTTGRFAHHVEDAFERMWAIHEMGEGPRPVYVEPPDNVISI